MPTACVAPDTAAGHTAAETLLSGDDLGDTIVGLADVATALRRVADATHAAAVVPFEDSRDGTHATTVDTLVFEVADLLVTAEVDLVGDDATTRWVTVRPRADAPPPPSDVPVQSLFFAIPHLNRPGVLAEMLAAFSSRGINVGRFEPRPLHGALGMYGFLLEVDGHPGQDWVAEALADLLTATSSVTHLGTLATGERAWSAVSGRRPIGTAIRDRGDLAHLVAAWDASS